MRVLPDKALDGESRAREGPAMTTLKVIEVLSQSDKSWEDAAQTAVNDAAKSLRGIKSIYVKELEAVVENNRVTQYRVNARSRSWSKARNSGRRQ
jgi:hypothetical protein